MKYLFIVQGEGRGHLMQAQALYDLLNLNGHTVVEILVGISPHRQIPDFFIQHVNCRIHTFESPNFLPSGKNNKVPLLKSVIYNTKRSSKYLKSINFMYERLVENQPDVVVNFYDFIAGIMYEIKRPDIRFVCIAHQYLFLHRGFQFQHLLLDPELPSFLFFTRLTCLRANKILALSFGEQPLTSDGNIHVVPPILRKEVLDSQSEAGSSILGYLLNSSYQKQVKDWHSLHPEYPLDFFWDEKDVADETWIDDTLVFHQLNDKKFIRFMAKCRAYATTGGFESVCEAIYLQKPIIMVPAHIEQRCNVLDATRIRAGVTDNYFNLSKLLRFIPTYKPNTNFAHWVKSADRVFLKHLND